MKNTLIIALMFVSTALFAKNITSKIQVKAQCDMCKEKIEKAMDMPGVSYAKWDQASQMLTVKYNDAKITEDKIHQTIANLGYATSKMEANTTAQKNLDKCCQPKAESKSSCASKGSDAKACGAKADAKSCSPEAGDKACCSKADVKNAKSADSKSCSPKAGDKACCSKTDVKNAESAAAKSCAPKAGEKACCSKKS